MPTPPIILLTFANDADAPLRELATEQDELRAVFRQAERDGKCKVEIIADATPAKIIQAFQEYRGKIRIFHYGGHSDEDALFLRNAYQQNEGIQASDLAEFLALQEGVELVFLNSCLSLPQAEACHQAGVKAVIATNRKIGDVSARHFARSFYNGLATGADLPAAYQEAEKAHKIEHQDRWRAVGFMDMDDEVLEGSPWQLFPENPPLLRLPFVAKHLTRIPTIDLKKEFLGREGDLQRLKEKLESTSKVVLMNGLGGIGKTVLATAYVQQYGGNFDHLAWINRGEDLIQSIALDEELAHGLDIPFEKEEELEARFRRILQTMHRLPGQNLLVIDNAQEQVAQKEIYGLLPGAPHWRVLLTSRLTLDGFDRLPLDTLGPEASKALFRTHYQGACTEKELDALLEEIGYHTLTVELLAKLLDKLNNLLSVAELTKILRQRQLDDPDLQEKIRTTHSGEEQGIYLHLTKAFELTQLMEREVWLLQQFVALPVERYEVADLAALLQEKPLNLNKILNSLAAKGWLTLHEDKQFSIHRLIRQVVEYKQKPTYVYVKALVDSITDLLSIDYDKDNPVDKFPYLFYGARILEIIPNQPEAEFTDFQSNLAAVYKALGDYERARDLMQATLQSAIRNLGEEHPDTARSRSNLALVYQDLGDYEHARDLLQVALQSAIRNLGEEHPDTATFRSNLALVYQTLGDYEQARDLLQVALQSDIRNFGENHPSTAISRSSLATVYQALGGYDQARDLLQAALKSDVRNFGENHPSTARSRSNLAIVYRDMGDYEQARDLLQAALQSAIRNLGEEHPSTATFRSNLASVYQALGGYDQARDLLQVALQSAIRNLGEEHPSTATFRSNLASVYKDLGSYDQARDLLQVALQSAIRNLGEEHPSTATFRSNLATVYQALGDYKQARNLMQAALQSDIRNFGEEHPSTARSRSNLATVYKALGDYKQARNLMQAALQSTIRNFGEEHPSTAIRRSNLAAVYKDLGDYEQARDLMQAALQSTIRNFGEEHPSTARSRSKLATLYQALGGYEQARDLMQAALQSTIRNFGEEHPDTAISRANLALVYQDLGDYEHARDLMQAALQSTIRNFGEEHPSTAIRRSNLATVYKDLGEYEQARELFQLAYHTLRSLLGGQHPHTKVVKQWLDSLE